MDKEYSDFHNLPKTQTRIIKSNNFTYRNVIETLESFLDDRKQKILDYGCGVGTLDFYLASKGHLVWGVDISSVALRVGRKSAKAMGLEKKVKFISLNQKINSKFDLVICSEVLEHVRDDEHLLRYLLGLLRPEGILFISVPSKNAPLYKLGFAERFDKSVGHLHRYDVNHLKRMFSKLGLKVIAVRKTEGILRNSLYVIGPINFLVRFLRGPISDLVKYIDNIFLFLFGESDISILGKKI